MTYFETESLGERLLVMASRAEASVAHAMGGAPVQRDDDAARKVREEDDAIDQLEKEIDEQAIRLSKAPLATQLRLIVTTLKIAWDLERVGDEATTIARRSIELSQEPQLKPYVDLPRMAALACGMLNDALEAFARLATRAAPGR